MKPSVVLINTARGNLINERVLIHFLQKKEYLVRGWMYLKMSLKYLRNYYCLIMCYYHLIMAQGLLIHV